MVCPGAGDSMARVGWGFLGKASFSKETPVESRRWRHSREGHRSKGGAPYCLEVGKLSQTTPPGELTRRTALLPWNREVGPSLVSSTGQEEQLSLGLGKGAWAALGVAGVTWVCDVSVSKGILHGA